MKQRKTRTWMNSMMTMIHQTRKINLRSDRRESLRLRFRTANVVSSRAHCHFSHLLPHPLHLRTGSVSAAPIRTEEISIVVVAHHLPPQAKQRAVGNVQRDEMKPLLFRCQLLSTPSSQSQSACSLARKFVR